jgi:hypothetical protein
MPNDVYWIKFAEDRLTNSIVSRENAASKLENFLTILWTTYTGVFLSATALSFISLNDFQLAFLSLPLVTILVARIACVRVLDTVDGIKTDTQDVPQIISAQQKIVESKISRLRNARRATFVAMLSLALAFWGLNFYDDAREAKIAKKKAEAELELVKAQHTNTIYFDEIKAQIDTINAQVLIERKKYSRDSLFCALDTLNSKLDSCRAAGQQRP